MNLWIILGILSGWEILIVVAVFLLLFGGKKIPELMKGLGRGVKEFKDGINNVEEENKEKDISKNKK